MTKLTYTRKNETLTSSTGKVEKCESINKAKKMSTALQANGFKVLKWQAEDDLEGDDLEIPDDLDR